MLEQLMKNGSPLEGPTPEKLRSSGGLSPMGGIPHWSRGKV